MKFKCSLSAGDNAQQKVVANEVNEPSVFNEDKVFKEFGDS